MNQSPPNRSDLVMGVIGIILYVMVGWFYLASGLMVPGPWLYILWAIWIGGLWVLTRVFRRNPVWTPAVPVGAAIVWVAFVQLGSSLLGWTA